jgi:hypothetical protein
LLHGIDIPDKVDHRNTLAKAWNDWSNNDKVDCVITNPPFGGMEDDGVGNADLKNAFDENQRFLSLTGVILSLEHVQNFLNPQMENLKAKYFNSHPDDPVIFHRKEMVNAKHPFTALQNDLIREQFNDELLELIQKTEFQLITIVIDKKEQNEQYASTWKYNPYHYCLAVLIERYCLLLKRLNCEGDVMAESRGGKEDIRLKKSFRKLIEEGTSYIQSADFQEVFTSNELKVKSKLNNISGLQLCDLIAHPSRREILLENKKIMDTRKDIFGDKISEILKSKYDSIKGKLYGKKLLP